MSRGRYMVMVVGECWDSCMVKLTSAAGGGREWEWWEGGSVDVLETGASERRGGVGRGRGTDAWEAAGTRTTRGRLAGCGGRGGGGWRGGRWTVVMMLATETSQGTIEGDGHGWEG